MAKTTAGSKDSIALNRLGRLMTSGNLWLYIVSICAKKGAHAYALPEMIEKRFGFKPSRLMCYLVLYRLKSEGMIESRAEGRRVYYLASAFGKLQLARARAYLKRSAKAI